MQTFTKNRQQECRLVSKIKEYKRQHYFMFVFLYLSNFIATTTLQPPLIPDTIRGSHTVRYVPS